MSGWINQGHSIRDGKNEIAARQRFHLFKRWNRCRPGLSCWSFVALFLDRIYKIKAIKKPSEGINLFAQDSSRYVSEVQ